MNTNDWTKQAGLWGKIALTGGLLYLLMLQTDFQKGRELLHHIHLPLLLAAIGLHLLAFLCGSLRWWLLLRYVNPQCSYRDIFPAYYLGLFSNNFLPTGFGGDVVRTAYLSVRGYQVSQLLSSTLVDRVLGLLVLLLTGLLTVLLQDDVPLDKNNMLFLCSAILAILFGGWLLFSPILLSGLRKRQQISHYGQFYRILIDLLEIFHAYRQSSKLLLNGMLLSLLLQVLVIGVYALLGYSLGLNLPLAAYFIIVPLVMLATNIPISLGGLGLREGALVALLLGAGVNYEQGVLLSLLYLLVLLGATLPGGLMLLKISLPRTVFSCEMPNSLKET